MEDIIEQLRHQSTRFRAGERSTELCSNLLSSVAQLRDLPAVPVFGLQSLLSLTDSTKPELYSQFHKWLQQQGCSPITGSTIVEAFLAGAVGHTTSVGYERLELPRSSGSVEKLFNRVRVIPLEPPARQKGFNPADNLLKWFQDVMSQALGLTKQSVSSDQIVQLQALLDGHAYSFLSAISLLSLYPSPGPNVMRLLNRGLGRIRPLLKTLFLGGLPFDDTIQMLKKHRDWIDAHRARVPATLWEQWQASLNGDYRQLAITDRVIAKILENLIVEALGEPLQWSRRRPAEYGVRPTDGLRIYLTSFNPEQR